MPFKELQEGVVKLWPEGTPNRVIQLDALDRLRDGTIYSTLRYPFSQEFDGQGGQDYIELAKRRPSVRYDLAKIIVDETSAMAFGKGHAPYAEFYDPLEDDAAEGDQGEGESSDSKIDLLNKIVAYLRRVALTDAMMVEAMVKGSSGSAAVIVKIKPDKTPWFRIIAGKFGHPTFHEDNPDLLIQLDEIYETTAEELLKRDYTWAELRRDPTEAYKKDTKYVINIRLGLENEQWMKPLRLDEYARLGLPKDEKDPDNGVYEWEEDDTRIWAHGWKNKVPAQWVRNLQEREEIDGPCIYAEIADLIIEIDYLLSQTGRGFKYSMDPLLAFEKDVGTAIQLPLGGDGLSDQYTVKANIARTPARALRSDGSIKMLEIAGNGLTAAREFIKLLREWALEVIGGMKSDQEHAGGPQSGRALEILHQALVWLVDRLCNDYGDGLLIPLINLCFVGLKEGIIELKGISKEKIPDLDLPTRLVWPEWQLPHGSDLYQTVQALVMAAGGSAQEPKQIGPMEEIFKLMAQAVGYPDPNRFAKKAMAEFKEFRDIQIKQNEPQPKADPGGGSAS